MAAISAAVSQPAGCRGRLLSFNDCRGLLHPVSGCWCRQSWCVAHYSPKAAPATTAMQLFIPARTAGLHAALRGALQELAQRLAPSGGVAQQARRQHRAPAGKKVGIDVARVAAGQR